MVDVDSLKAFIKGRLGKRPKDMSRWEKGKKLARSLPTFPKMLTNENAYGVALRMPRDWPGPRWLEASPDNIRLWKRAWGRIKHKRRDDAQLQQTPKWADQKKIRAIYHECRERSKATGVPHHVDHVLPLLGGLVCGLHVENNLAIVPAGDNLKKGASHEPSHVEKFLLRHPRPANEGDQRFLNWSAKLAQAEAEDWWDRLSPEIKHQFDLAQETRAWREITKQSKRARAPEGGAGDKLVKSSKEKIKRARLKFTRS